MALRFVALDLDPPYGIVSSSGEFLTDEGWYSKSAQLLHKYGVWSTEHDLVWYSHNPLFTLIQSWAFDVFGVGLETARALSGVAFAATIAAFYLICRAAQTRVMALVTCLLVSLTLHNLAYSRLALIEPVGVAVSMLALVAWVRLPGRFLGALLACLLASAAFFVKISFIFTGCAVAVLVLGEAALLVRARRFGRAAAYAATLAVVGVATWVVHREIVEWSSVDGLVFQTWHVDQRVKALGLVKVLRNEVKVLFSLFYSTGAPTLTCSIAFALVFFAIKRRFRPDLPVSRATIALLVWGAGGTAFFGLFRYQPPRYLYFSLFPIAYFAILLARDVVGVRFWRLAGLYLLFLHVAVQVPGYVGWLRRPELHTARDTALDVIARVRRDSGPGDVVLMGGTSSYVGFFDPDLRPIDYRWEDQLEERMRRWRPHFLLSGRSTIPRLTETLPGLVAGTEEVASYRLLGNYYGGEDHVLVRIRYAE